MKILLSLLAVLTFSLPIEAADVVQLRWSKTVTFESTSKDALVAAPLDADIYAGTSDNFSDLRIMAADGEAVPYVLRKRSVFQTRVEQKPWTAADGQPDLKPLENGGLDIRVRLTEKDPQPNGVRFITPLRNFEQTVTVFGTEPGQTEQELVSEARIFDYSDYMDVRRIGISLPKSKAREFRVVVVALKSDRESPFLEVSRQMKGKDEASREERTVIERRPFRIDRIEFWGDVTHQSVREDAVADWPATGFKVSEDSEHKRTIIEVQTRREPLFRFNLDVSSRNFSRAASVEVPDSRSTESLKLGTAPARWRSIGSGQIHRVEFGEIKEERLVLNFPETRSETYRILIENQDNSALAVTGVKPVGNDYQTIFMADPSKTYSLSYSSTESITSPVYDTAAIRTVLANNVEPIAATIGPAIEAALKPESVKPRDVLNNPLLLGCVIVLLVGLLAWALFRAGQRIDQLPPSEN
jgi:hypothetical protein